MNSQETALKFVHTFCEADLQSLSTVLIENFKLNGPLYQFNSKSDCLELLKRNLDPDPEAIILSSFQNGEEAAVFYKYL